MTGCVVPKNKQLTKGKPMKSLITLSILLVSVSAFADFSPSKRFDATDVRAMGGVSLASGTPAAASIDNKWNFSIVALALDMRGSLSEGITAYNWAHSALDFKDSLNDLNLTNVSDRYNRLLSLVSTLPRAFDFQSRMDFARIQFGNSQLGTFMVGVYAEGLMGIRLTLPPANNITTSGSTIDLGQPTTLLTAAGRGDTGGRVGYGRIFNLPKGMLLSSGIHLRVFNRWLVRPYKISVDSKITGSNSFHVPDFTYDAGVGGAVDLSSILLLRDKLLDTRIGLEINSIGATHYTSRTERETMAFALGAMIKPLHVLNVQGWDIGSELHAYEDGRPSLHLGTSYTFGHGRWISFSPRIGGIIADRMVFGETRNVFTGGFTTVLGIVQLAGVIELFNGGYDAGVRLALGN